MNLPADRLPALHLHDYKLVISIQMFFNLLLRTQDTFTSLSFGISADIPSAEKSKEMEADDEDTHRPVNRPDT